VGVGSAGVADPMGAGELGVREPDGAGLVEGGGVGVAGESWPVADTPDRVVPCACDADAATIIAAVPARKTARISVSDVRVRIAFTRPQSP
jgi:hypothetical protein